jgi:GNAT superfamily N-acetyltransferase
MGASTIGRAERETAGPWAVERLTHEGIPEIVVLYKRVWDRVPNLPTELVKSWTPTALEFSSWMEGVTYFTVRGNGRLVGAIGCEIRDGSCRLVRLVVEGDTRRKGVATALVRQALEWARHNHCPSVWADALGPFGDAAKLLKKLGFVEAGVLHRHYFGEDVRLFETVL